MSSSTPVQMPTIDATPPTQGAPTKISAVSAIDLGSDPISVGPSQQVDQDRCHRCCDD